MLPLTPDPAPAPARRRPPAWLLAVVVILLVAAGLVAIAIRGGDGEGGAELGAGGPAASAPASEPEPASPATSEAPPTTTSVGEGVSPAQKRVFDQLMKEVAAVRGLQWRGPLNLRVISPDEIVRRVHAANARDIDPAQFAAQEQALKLLRLIPADIDLRALFDDLAGLVLGFYDPLTKELFVGGEELDVSTRYTIVHEMTHALTDQVFNYGPTTDALDKSNKTEEASAYSALIEGDAVLTQQLWADQHLSPEEALLAALGGGGSGDASAVARTPPYVLKSLFFPYDEGFEFVETLHDRGGFDAVNAAYRKPPISTEQIIHPETYTSGQASTTPPLPDIAAATGCAPVYKGAVGQFDMRALLSQRLAEREAEAASQGWNGDNLNVVRCGSALGLVDRWETDPGTDPSRLVTAVSQWAGLWSGSGRSPSADGRFSGPNGSGRISLSGSRVDLVLAADAATADRLVRALG